MHHVYPRGPRPAGGYNCFECYACVCPSVCGSVTQNCPIYLKSHSLIQDTKPCQKQPQRGSAKKVKCSTEINYLG